MTLLQKEEVRLGKAEDLSEEAIALYADPHLNYLQMNRLRTALKEGMELEVLRRRKAVDSGLAYGRTD